jgi:hypothetical protein
MRKASSTLAIATLIGAGTLGGVAAGASTPSAKSLTKDLLTAAYAKKAGFSDAVEKANTSDKTGVTSCPDGAQEAFENTATQSGLVAEVLVCSSKAAATALLTGVREKGSASVAPPKQLGAAAERRSDGPVYSIYWQRGDVFEFVGLETGIASSTSSTTTTIPAPPISAAEQKILAGAALSEFKRLS